MRFDTTENSHYRAWQVASKNHMINCKIGSMYFAKLNYHQMQFVERTPNICPAKISAYMVFHVVRVKYQQRLIHGIVTTTTKINRAPCE